MRPLDRCYRAAGEFPTAPCLHFDDRRIRIAALGAYCHERTTRLRRNDARR
jgi:hypothetical protein